MDAEFFCYGGPARRALERLYGEEITVAKCIELLQEADEAVCDEFGTWLAREMPPGTVISAPLWWAPRIFRAARSARVNPLTDAQRGEIAYQLTKRLVIDMPTARAAVDAAIADVTGKPA